MSERRMRMMMDSIIDAYLFHGASACYAVAKGMMAAGANPADVLSALRHASVRITKGGHRRLTDEELRSMATMDGMPTEELLFRIQNVICELCVEHGIKPSPMDG